MRVRVFHLGLIFFLLACPASSPVSGPAPGPRDGGRGDGSPKGHSVAEPTKAAPAAALEAASEPAAATTDLPPSTRAFAVSFEPGAPDVVLGTWEDTLWARRPSADGFDDLWVSKGPGAVQAVAVGELGEGRALFVGRGRARGNLIPFVRVDRVDPQTGASRPLWREESERADIAQLFMADASGDGRQELVVGYFETKHRVGVRHLLADGSVRRGAPEIMATSRLIVDLDRDGKPDEVIGRVYGDDQGSPGDLTVRLGDRTVPIPTDRGVRALGLARLSGGDAPAVLFADGWAANYGVEGRAKLAAARLRGDELEVQRLAESPGEYTLFSIFVIPAGDHDRVLVQGSRHLSLLVQDESGAFALRRLRSFDNGAGQGTVGRGPGESVWWYWPGDEGTTATRLDLDE